MKYNQPFGQSNPNAPYINGDPSVGRKGSIPPAEQMEYPQREVMNVIEASGQVGTNDDLFQLLKAIRFFGGNIKNGVDTGTKNKIVVTLDPAPLSYTKLFCLVQKMGAANDAAMTIDINGMGEKPLKDLGGAALSSGALVGGGVFLLWFDGTQMRVLGGTSSYSTISGLTASGGVATDVAVDGVVNHNIDKPAHNTTFARTDIHIRRTSGGVTYKNTLGELIDWIETEIDFPAGEDPIYLEGGFYKSRRATRTQIGVARRATTTEVTNRAASGGALDVFVGPEDLPNIDPDGVGVGAAMEVPGGWLSQNTFPLGASRTGEKFLNNNSFGTGVTLAICATPSTLIATSDPDLILYYYDARRASLAADQTWTLISFKPTKTNVGGQNDRVNGIFRFKRTS